MNYLRMCWYYLFEYDVEKDGGLYKLTGWQHIRATDGPIHSVWSWWGSIRYSWFVIGWHCWQKGHAWREENITDAPERAFVVVKPGHARRENTGRHVMHKVTVCGWCGKYRGHWSKVIER